MLEANLDLQKNLKCFSADAIRLLLDAPWPGNVRELKNVVKRAALLAENDTITTDEISIGEADRFIIPASLPAHSTPVTTLSATGGLAGAGRPTGTVAAAQPSAPSPSMNDKVTVAREGIEKEELIKALHSVGGNKVKAARALKIDRSTLYAKIKKYGLSRI